MADLKSFQARDVYGMAVVTSLVAQNTRGVQLIEHVSNQMLEAQLDSVFPDIKPQAVKQGCWQLLRSWRSSNPILKAGLSLCAGPCYGRYSGDTLIDTSARSFLKTNLLPLATITTPHLPEAEEIVGFQSMIQQDMQRAGRLIIREFGPQSVVIKVAISKAVPRISSLLRRSNLSGKAHEFKPVTPMVLDVPLLL